MDGVDRSDENQSEDGGPEFEGIRRYEVWQVSYYNNSIVFNGQYSKEFIQDYFGMKLWR